MLLPTFVIGPEPGGRGYKILASSGIDRNTGWAGNAPLVLLDWAKRRSRTGFSGRFPVAGGAIMLRAHYVEEGSAGPIAFANGVFIPEAELPRAYNNERAIFEAIPFDGPFGNRPVEIEDNRFAVAAIAKRDGLGLAWEDRQIFAADNIDLNDEVLKALESIVPLVQRPRVQGWSTTGLLASRGDFLPIMTCNLLVTKADEPRADDRLIPCKVAADGKYSGTKVDDPPSYKLWLRMIAAGSTIVSEQSNAALSQCWKLGMESWPDKKLAWHFLETISQQGESFATMVEAVAIVGAQVNGQVAGEVVEDYLKAMAGQPLVTIAGLVKRFEERLAAIPEGLAQVRSFVALSGDPALLSEASDEELLQLVRLLENKRDWPARNTELWASSSHRVGLLEDRAASLCNSPHNFALRSGIALVHRDLDDLPGPGAPPPSRAEAHRLLRLRETMPAMPG